MTRPVLNLAALSVLLERKEVSGTRNAFRFLTPFRNLVKLNPELAWTHTALAGAQLRNGEHAAALRSLDESDRLGRDWHARVTNDFLRAIALARLGRTSEARSIFEEGASYVDSHLAPAPAAPFGETSESHPCDWYAIRSLRRKAAELLHEAGSDEKSATDRPASFEPVTIRSCLFEDMYVFRNERK